MRLFELRADSGPHNPHCWTPLAYLSMQLELGKPRKLQVSELESLVHYQFTHLAIPPLYDKTSPTQTELSHPLDFTMNTIRPISILRFPPSLRPILAARLYATQTGLGTTNTPKPRRKAVTPFNDDGRVAWGDLTAGEKAARTTQQTFNFGFIALGAVMTVGRYTRRDYKV